MAGPAPQVVVSQETPDAAIVQWYRPNRLPFAPVFEVAFLPVMKEMEEDGVTQKTNAVGQLLYRAANGWKPVTIVLNGAHEACLARIVSGLQAATAAVITGAGSVSVDDAMEQECMTLWVDYLAGTLPEGAMVSTERVDF